MTRGVLYGAAAFVVAYAAEAQWRRLQRDISHYDAMRAMSGDSPFLHEQFARVKGLVGYLLAEQTPGAAGTSRGVLQSLREDVARYVTLETM